MWDPGAGQRVWVFQHLGIESLLENADILDLERDWYFMIDSLAPAFARLC